MSTSQAKTPATPRNHFGATLAVVLALVAVILPDFSLWLVAPSLLAAGLGWRGIHKNPQAYTGKVFIYAALGLNILLITVFLIAYFI